MKRSLARLAALAGLAASCDPVAATPSAIPTNTCAAYPCERYDAQAGLAACSAGACVVDVSSITVEAGTSPTDDLVLLVTTSQNGFFYPGLTFALPYDVLRDEALALDAGAAPGSASLPGAVEAFGLYLVTPQIAQQVNFSLGGPSALDTSLPIHATFEPLSISRPDGSVIGLGPLPVDTVASDSVSDMHFPNGPNGAPGMAVSVNLAPGTYRKTWTPVAPFDQAFGPVIQVVTPSAADRPNEGEVNFYDKTSNAMNTPELPTYTISRDQGSFDGWTAYLRDLTLDRPVSNVVPLSGKVNAGVQFAVRRVATGTPLQTPPGAPNPDLDALAGVELVVAPPTGSTEPTGLFTPLGNFLPPALLYPTLPPPVTVTGAIQPLQGAAGTVDLTFEALALTNAQGKLDAQSYEFSTWATATPDASGSAATYSVVVPPGEYRVDARPRTSASALVVADVLVPAQTGTFAAPPITLGEPQPTAGFVRVSDGRPLAGATVTSVPLACAPVSRSAPSTSWCMPRSTQSTSAPDGSFVLPLDPGSYRVHVEPPADSRLPWVDTETTLVVQGSAAIGALPTGAIVVPAPLSIGLRLTDSFGMGRGVPNALVRAYRVFGDGPTETALELGEALTDSDGRYELYVAPPE